MNVDKDSLVSLLGEEAANFVDAQFNQPSEYSFINDYVKSLKKQISLAVSYDKVINDEMTLDEFDNSLKSDIVVTANYRGYFIKGLIVKSDFYELLSFFSCNGIPKVDDVNNSLIFYNEQYRLFVNNFESDEKNIAVLFKDDSKEDISDVLNLYFNRVDEIKEMNDSDVLKLSYDVDTLNYQPDYFDNNTGTNLFEVQDALLKTYSYNPVDYLLTLALIYRLRLLGWDKKYIDFAASKNRGFNILNSTAHIKLNKIYISNIQNLGYIDDEYSITEAGRALILLLNYITPIDVNNYGGFFASVSNIVSTQKIAKENLLSLSMSDISLFGIRDEFFVNEKSLAEMGTGLFSSDANYSTTVLNSVGRLNKAKAVGFSSNVTLNANQQGLELEICQQLFNTFNNDTFNIVGGLVAIKTYKSVEPIYINSLIYRLIVKSNGVVEPYVSESDSDYVVFKNFSGKVVAIIKSKKFSCQKEFMGTQDYKLLSDNIRKSYGIKYFAGLNIVENQPSVIGIGFVEKAELTADDFKKMNAVPFRELRSVLGTINKDSYFSGLDENDVVLKIVSQRKDEYEKFVGGVKQEMNNKLKALELIHAYYVEIGNEEKKIYYADAIYGFKQKIDGFRI